MNPVVDKNPSNPTNLPAANQAAGEAALAAPAQSAQAKVGVIRSLRGVMAEVEILGQKPEEKELLQVEGHPEVFLEVNFFRANTAVCINLTNSQVLRCGQVVSRSGKKVTVPVGQPTLGRVFNALGEPLD